MNKSRVLVVDDDPLLLKFNALVLSPQFQVKTASSGMEALCLAETFAPDVVLLDVVMAEMDGFDTCVELRKVNACSSCKIVFVSAMPYSEGKNRCLRAGGNEYLCKPFDHQKLVRIIENQLVS